MIIDALLAAEPYMKIAEQVDNPDKYVHLTDTIMSEIEKSTVPVSLSFMSSWVFVADNEGIFFFALQELAKSRAIFDRIRTRDLYRIIDYKAFGYEHRERCRQLITPERIADAAKALSPHENAPSAEEVIVDICPMHYGMQEKNPLDFINFYSKRKPNGELSIFNSNVGLSR